MELPTGAEVIAFSEKTSVEAFVIGDHILGIQGHPEYTKDILYNIIHRLTENNVIDVKALFLQQFSLEKFLVTRA